MCSTRRVELWTNGSSHIADTGLMLISIDNLVDFGSTSSAL
jgi:hypothetical protein